MPDVTHRNVTHHRVDGHACKSAAAMGITITVAAGDNGSSDGVNDGKNHVNFPGSSPHVLCCGGTKITANGTLMSEVVWNDGVQGGATGGGVSAYFTLPTWQAHVGVPPHFGKSRGHGVPDVAGNASPASGYQVRVDGENAVFGGTGAVAPLWAGLIALSN